MFKLNDLVRAVKDITEDDLFIALAEDANNVVIPAGTLGRVVEVDDFLKERLIRVFFFELDADCPEYNSWWVTGLVEKVINE